MATFTFNVPDAPVSFVFGVEQTVLGSDATVTVNSTTFDTVASGGTLDVPVVNSAAAQVGTVNAGVNVVVPDATATVKNSAGTTIDSATIASGGSAILTITDSTVTIKDSANATLHTVTLAAETSANQTISDATVTAKNSANTTLGSTTVVAEGTANISISDITYTDALGSASSVAAGVNITATRVNAMTCANLNGELTDAQRQVIQRITPLKTGQTTSYRTGGDGDLQKGRLSDFTTLTCNNGFGNTNRFTDETGAQTYTNNLVCDWATGLMWYRTLSALSSWNTAIDAAEASTQASYTDWRIPNRNEINGVINSETVGGLNYSPFSISDNGSQRALWTSTTVNGSTTSALVWWWSYNSAIFKGAMWGVLKTNTTNCYYIMCRNFTLSDLGL